MNVHNEYVSKDFFSFAVVVFFFHFFVILVHFSFARKGDRSFGGHGRWRSAIDTWGSYDCSNITVLRYNSLNLICFCFGVTCFHHKLYLDAQTTTFQAWDLLVTHQLVLMVSKLCDSALEDLLSAVFQTTKVVAEDFNLTN